MMRLIAAVLLVLAAACNRQAPAENKPAPAVLPVPAPPPAPVTNMANAATPAPEPAQEAEPEAAPAEEAEEPPPTPEEETTEAEEEAPAPLRGCAREIGEQRAQRLVRQCLMVSTASRPPCNVENSCALIRSEIARGCGMAGEDAPRFCR